jgi:hypothetical protein
MSVQIYSTAWQEPKSQRKLIDNRRAIDVSMYRNHENLFTESGLCPWRDLRSFHKRQAIYQARKLHIRHRQFSSKESGVSMLRIETEVDDARTILRLIGRVRSDCIEELRQRVQNQGSLMVLDLAEVDLVDLQSVRFLRDCQDQKIELRNCAPYILEWIRRERIEGPKR